MRYVNNTGFPEFDIYAKAMNWWFSRYDRGDSVYTITELNDAPQIRILKDRHWDEIELPISKNWFAMFGTIMHEFLSRIEGGDYFQEWRLYAEVRGVRISGQIDRINIETGAIEDHKLTSVWNYMLGGQEKWTQQLNGLGYLTLRNGMEKVNSLKDLVTFRDWRPGESLSREGYPPPQLVYHAPVWPLDKMAAYIEGRVELHQRADAGENIPCTREDRWTRDECFAVHKIQANGETSKAAVRNGLFKVADYGDDAEKAQKAAQDFAIAKCDAHAKKDPKYKGESFKIIHRPGRQVRCEYCPVAQFCDQYRLLQIAENVDVGVYDALEVKKVTVDRMIERKAV